MAWHIAALPRCEKMPDLNEMTGAPRRIVDNPERLLASLAEWKAEARALKKA